MGDGISLRRAQEVGMLCAARCDLFPSAGLFLKPHSVIAISLNLFAAEAREICIGFLKMQGTQ